MADIITLTQQPIRITALSRQNVWAAVDVSAYDMLDMEVVCTIEGTATSAQLNLLTGMHAQSDDGWYVTPTTFGTISGTGIQIAKCTVNMGFLRYLRWDCSSGTTPAGTLGGATAITFFIRGMARRYA